MRLWGIMSHEIYCSHIWRRVRSTWKKSPVSSASDGSKTYNNSTKVMIIISKYEKISWIVFQCNGLTLTWIQYSENVLFRIFFENTSLTIYFQSWNPCYQKMENCSSFHFKVLFSYNLKIWTRMRILRLNCLSWVTKNMSILKKNNLFPSKFQSYCITVPFEGFAYNANEFS